MGSTFQGNARDYEQFLKELNKEIAVLAKSNNHGRNYIRLFRPHNGHKVNIMGTFYEVIEKENGKAPHFSRKSRMSFGMLPEEQFEKYRIMTVGKNSIFARQEDFAVYIDRYYKNFCVEKEEYERRKWQYATMEIWQKAFFARCVIAASWACCFSLQIWDASALKNIKEILNDDPACLYKENGMNIRIFGRPQEETLRRLQRYGIRRNQHGRLQVVKRESDVQDGFVELYNAAYQNMYKHEGKALYSGVIPRLLRVDYIEPSIENETIEKFLLHMGRTSYLTMYGMGRVDVLEHPFMKKIELNGRSLSEWNKIFDAQEVSVQNQFLHETANKPLEEAGAEACRRELDCLNRYLRHSWNVHNINISGNLITSDDYCIYTRRSSTVEDGGNYYCSVNGASEIDDDAVVFYNTSVEEDIPTIKYNKEPVYFSGELTREAVGELGIIDNSRVWKYYGLTMMGHIEQENDLQRIWFHFNVLGEKKCMDTFIQICEQKKEAAEDFENTDVYGYSLRLFETKSEDYWDRGKWLVESALEQKDSITLLIVFGICAATGQQFLTLDNMLAAVFMIVTLLMIGIRWRIQWNKRKWQKVVRLQVNRQKVPYDWFLKLFQKGEKERADSIFMMLSALRLERIFRDEEYGK